MIPGYESERGDHAQCVRKLVGADAELGNWVEGLVRDNGTGREAARALLREIDGVRSTPPGSAVSPGGEGIRARLSSTGPYDTFGAATDEWENPQDIGRKYLASNGGCVYIDLNHLEVCTPEIVSARDFVAAWLAMLRIVRDALVAANTRCPPGQRIVVLVNSSDGLGNAYGSHLSFLVTRRLWDDLFTRRLHPDLFVLAAYQVSSIVCTGQGKAGAENGRPEVPYQIAQRADFFDQLVGPQTTYNRPIVNSRNEPLCGTPRPPGAYLGNGGDLARLHCIFYDSTLCQVSTLLKVGVMQIVLSMLEARWLDASLMLDDPVTALVGYSHDPGLSKRAPLADGRSVTAVELQRLFWERARAYVDGGGCDELVPGAAAIVDLWGDTLDKLAERDFDALAPRLDWVLKYVQIERALVSRGLDWSAPEAKHLDHVYSSLDSREGLYWAMERAGHTEALVDEAQIDYFQRTPPVDTRAWTRAMLLRQLSRDRIRGVDWDRIELAPTVAGSERLVLDLPDPLGHTRTHWRIAAGGDHGTPMPATPAAGGDDTIFNRGGEQR